MSWFGGTSGGGGGGGGGDVNVVSVNGLPVTLDGLSFHLIQFNPVRGLVLTLVAGDSYTVSVGRPIVFTDSTYPTLAGLAANAGKLSIRNVTDDIVVVNDKSSFYVDDTSKTLKFELTGTETNQDPLKRYRFDMEVHHPGGNVVTLVRGVCKVLRNI